MLNPDEIEKAENNSTVEIKINEERPWESFANHNVKAYQKGRYKFATVSLESFHDGIHDLIGTGHGVRSSFTGHMGDPRYAAVSVQSIPSRAS